MLGYVSTQFGSILISTIFLLLLEWNFCHSHFCSAWHKRFLCTTLHHFCKEHSFLLVSTIFSPMTVHKATLARVILSTCFAVLVVLSVTSFITIILTWYSNIVVSIASIVVLCCISINFLLALYYFFISITVLL